MSYVNVENTIIHPSAFGNLKNVETVDCSNAKVLNNNMSGMFYNLSNLKSVSNINDDVTTMIGSFAYCTKLVSVNKLPSNLNTITGKSQKYGKSFYSYDLESPVVYNNASYNTIFIDNIPQSYYDIYSTNVYINNGSMINVSKSISLESADETYISIYSNSYINGNRNITSDFYNNYYPENISTGLFYDCSSLVNAPVIPNGVTSIANCFEYCSSLITIPSFPSNITNMYSAFRGCTSLINVPTIPNSVTNMSDTFYDCQSLKEAPVIPNSVTSLYFGFVNCRNLITPPSIPSSVTQCGFCFEDCHNLTSAPVIPSSISDISCMFTNCYNLTSAPEIPSSITDIDYTFNGCYNLVGNITIYSNKIAYAYGTFQGTTKIKSVFIPFKSGSAYSKTYNTFVARGLGELETSDNAHLRDISKINNTYTLTINPTPSDATVTLTAEGYTQEGNSITTKYGTIIHYSVNKEGYISQSDDISICQNKTIDINIQSEDTFDIDTLKLGDRISNVATVVGNFTDGDGKSYVFAVLDAKYRTTRQDWALEKDMSEYYSGFDTILPNYSSKSQVLEAKESATHNTDLILNTYTSTDYPIFKMARDSISITIKGKTYQGQLPNAYELQQIYNNKETLDALDTSLYAFKNSSLSTWKISDALSWTWCSNECDEYSAWAINDSGELISYYDKGEGNLIPILEIPID